VILFVDIKIVLITFANKQFLAKHLIKFRLSVYYFYATGISNQSWLSRAHRDVLKKSRENKLVLAYTKFNGFQKPLIARSKLACYYLQKTTTGCR